MPQGSVIKQIFLIFLYFFNNDLPANIRAEIKTLFGDDSTTKKLLCLVSLNEKGGDETSDKNR